MNGFEAIAFNTIIVGQFFAAIYLISNRRSVYDLTAGTRRAASA